MPLLCKRWIPHEVADLISVRERKYGNISSLVPSANNACTTNKKWRTQPKSVRTGSAWLTTNSTLQADGWGAKRSTRNRIAMDYMRGARGCVVLPTDVLPISTFVPNAPKTLRISEVDKKHSNDKTKFQRIL